MPTTEKTPQSLVQNSVQKFSFDQIPGLFRRSRCASGCPSLCSQRIFHCNRNVIFSCANLLYLSRLKKKAKHKTMATPGVLLRRNLPAQAVLLLVHFLYNFVERLLLVLRKFQSRNKTESIPKDDGEGVSLSCWENRLARESASVEYGVRGLAKIPAHLVVMLGPEVPDYRQLARFICWGLAAGVGHVSFYDHRGTLKRNHHRVLEHMVRLPRADSDQIVWTAQLKPGLPIPPRNGYRRRLVVSFFCPHEDGRGQLVQTARTLGQELKDGRIGSPEDITIETVDRKQRDHFRDVPDPDLAVYYGAVCCTYGLLPWQIRLTEFVQVRAPSLRDTGPDHLLDCLFRFAKCEQRFGK